MIYVVINGVAYYTGSFLSHGNPESEDDWVMVGMALRDFINEKVGPDNEDWMKN